MTVTKESEGRLNAFPKEPQIELLSKQPSDSNGSRIFLILGFLLLIGLIAFSFTIK
tara:strand:+ start:1170 stop:1337 length:168 start_codon:yes stop_codon:yes gene_type:complete